jgi:hypothetical protein
MRGFPEREFPGCEREFPSFGLLVPVAHRVGIDESVRNLSTSKYGDAVVWYVRNIYPYMKISLYKILTTTIF